MGFCEAVKILEIVEPQTDNKGTSMTVKYIIIALITLLVTVFCGCIGFNKPSPPVNYYIFDYKVPELPPLELLEAAVRLERFSVASPYDTDRIV
ncbi:MAG: hypothetical protein ACLFUE_07220, partial [Desulfobacteraceae bacterium]